MRPDISEFSYGYAVTEAFARGFGGTLTAAPTFLSLLEEGGAEGGYDVRIERNGVPLFLQFKLSDCMVRGTAYEARAGFFTPPFYRFHLRATRTSQQHRLLLNLEARGNSVFYIAPMFHLRDELNEAYFTRDILSRSVFVPPSDIGDLPDDDFHHIAFSPTAGGVFYLLSDPVRLEKPIDLERFTHTIRHDLAEKGRDALAAPALNRLARDMLAILHEYDSPSSVNIQRLANLDDPLRTVAYLSRTFFGSELLIIRPR